jgi:CheY-like chemotaxis protein
LPQKIRHDLRNDLNSLSIALHLFKQELDAGHCEDAESTFAKLVEYLERVCQNRAFSREGVVVDEGPVPTALLVEDEANEREMLAGFLRMHGYRVATAGDGLQAIEYLDSHDKPSVVLIDMRMPRCDGPTTIRRIRENPAFDQVKIFAISGSTPEENQLDTEQDGVNRWFMKPLNPKLLVDALAITRNPEPTAA